eukprot:357516-Chlamydomonas_euryale.AAC.19
MIVRKGPCIATAPSILQNLPVLAAVYTPIPKLYPFPVRPDRLPESGHVALSPCCELVSFPDAGLCPMFYFLAGWAGCYVGAHGRLEWHLLCAVNAALPPCACRFTQA